MHSFMNETTFGWMKVIGMLVAFVAFAAIVIWALTRTRNEIDHSARLPLHDDPQERQE